jgi:hydrogenase maturation protease
LTILIPTDHASAPRRIAVLCVGNLLMRDDGVGPRIAQELMTAYTFPENVEVFDEGCMGLALLPLLESYDYVLTVDAVDGTDAAPGTVVRFKPEDIAAYSQAVRSAHDMRFIDVLQAATLLGYTVEGYCIGIQSAEVYLSDPEAGLSPAVAAAVPLAVQTVLATLVCQGVEGIVSQKTGASVVPSDAFLSDDVPASRDERL